jgi:hypothetical protein
VPDEYPTACCLDWRSVLLLHVHARCWSSSAPYPSPRLTGEKNTPTLDWDGMRENVIVSRSHRFRRGRNHPLAQTLFEKDEANLNKCLVQDLSSLAPLDETQVRAAGDEQNGRTAKRSFFPFGSVLSLDTQSRRKKESLFRAGVVLPIDKGRPYKCSEARFAPRCKARTK